MSKTTTAALGTTAAALLAFAFWPSDAKASPAPEAPDDCSTDLDCLSKRGVVATKAGAGAVVAAGQLTSAASSPTGTQWVRARRAEGLEVVIRGKPLEGATLMALRPEDAAEVAKGGLFRIVGGV